MGRPDLLEPHDLGTVPTPLWLDATAVEPALGMTVLHGTPLVEEGDQRAAFSRWLQPQNSSTRRR